MTDRDFVPVPWGNIMALDLYIKLLYNIYI